MFDSADALLISEVKMLLEHRKAQYETQEEDHELSEVPPHYLTPLGILRVVCVCVCVCVQVFTKTLDYCQTFSKYNSKETISAVRE